MFNRWTVIILSLCTFGHAAIAAGEYNPDPKWKVAFVRVNNLWVMNADGSGQREILALDNISGRLTWSKDGKRIAFVRQGQVEIRYPDGTGGVHKCYDLFAAHIDSAGKNFWWYITNNLGSNFPEWSADDELFAYHYDLAANKSNAILPEYQIYYRNWDGTIEESIMPGGAEPGTYQGLQPTMSPDKKLVAFIYVQSKGGRATGMKDLGMVIVPRSGIKRSPAELEEEAKKFANAGCPAFSPDGKTIAYIDKTLTDNGIYLVSVADKTKRKMFAPTGGLQLRPNAISWSPDGQWLIFSSYDGNIYVLDHNGKNLKQISFGGNDYYPAFSK